MNRVLCIVALAAVIWVDSTATAWGVQERPTPGRAQPQPAARPLAPSDSSPRVPGTPTREASPERAGLAEARLVVTSMELAPAQPVAGGEIQALIVVENQGTAASGARARLVVRCSGIPRQPECPEAAFEVVLPVLAPGQRHREMIPLWARWDAGRYRLLAGVSARGARLQELQLVVQSPPSIAGRADPGPGAPAPVEGRGISPQPGPTSARAEPRIAGRVAAGPDEEAALAPPRAAPRPAPQTAEALLRPPEPQRAAPGQPTPSAPGGRLEPPRPEVPARWAPNAPAPTRGEAFELPGGPVLAPLAQLSFAAVQAGAQGKEFGYAPGATETTVYKTSLKPLLVWSSPYAQNYDWRWQVSLWPFPQNTGLTPQALLEDGDVPSDIFSIDLGSFPPLGKAGPTPVIASAGPPAGEVAISGLPPAAPSGGETVKAAGPPVSEEPPAGGGEAVKAVLPPLVSEKPPTGDVPPAIDENEAEPQAGAAVALPVGNVSVAEYAPTGPVDTPMDFYIRLVPTKNGQSAGPPSNVVVAHYVPGPDPAQEAAKKAISEWSYAQNPPPLFNLLKIDAEIPPASNPELASCVRIVSEFPPFPAGVGALGVYVNPDGSTVPIGGGGTKITGTLPYTLGQSGLALYPFTACPGEKGTFQWGSVGCDPLDPLCNAGELLGDAAQAAIEAGEFLVGLANGVAEAYNELKAWAIDQVASVVCPESVGGECKTLINVGVDILLTSVGVPPTMPNFGDLANLAKGELVDLALDQLGVGAACDAVATAGTGKSCGELASQLHDLDACTLAPKGQEDNCRKLLKDAEAACKLAANSSQCKALTTNAQDLVKAGFSEVYDQSIAAIEQQVTQASLEALGFYTPFPGTAQDHYCHWEKGGTSYNFGYRVVCPPDTYSKVKGTVEGLFKVTPGQSVPGCSLGTFGQDQGKVVCSFPPRQTVATPEPLGGLQPIKVDVWLARNDKPLPKPNTCGPLSAEVTTQTPLHSQGQPYLPATAPLGKSIFATEMQKVTLWFDKPGPNAQKLLQAGSKVRVKISGKCIPETEGPGALVGEIPPPKPRITPANP